MKRKSSLMFQTHLIKVKEREKRIAGHKLSSISVILLGVLIGLGRGS
jgi:hypothetical protein